MSEKVKVLLVEDHTIVREGLRLLLASQEESIHISGEAKGGREAVKLARESRPDVVVMDISLPDINGIEATKLIKESLPRTKVIALTMYANEEFVLQMMKAGASGYLIKNADSNELLNAIKIVTEKNLFYCPSISEKDMQEYIEKITNQEEKDPTRREKEVLELIARGYSSKRIADMLFISPKTVRNHRANIMEKLNIHNVVSLVTYAAKRNLVDIFSPFITGKE